MGTNALSPEWAEALRKKAEAEHRAILRLHEALSLAARAEKPSPELRAMVEAAQGLIIALQPFPVPMGEVDL